MKKLLLFLLLSLPAFGAHSVTLHWTAPVTGTPPDHYKVYRSLTSGSGYVLMGEIPASATGFVNGSNPNGTPLTEGVTYFYVVTSVAGTAESSPSNEVPATITVTTGVQAPSNLTGVVQ
jgi:hypothetical protein